MRPSKMPSVKISLSDSTAVPLDGASSTETLSIFLIIVSLLIVLKAATEIVSSYIAAERLNKAEKEAFVNSSSPDDSTGCQNQDQNRPILMSRLFHLYGAQIDKYQQATQVRATYSFLLAVFSMCAGLLFVFWGGISILENETGAKGITAGAAITTIGGGISAYITKTFLDVHKLSLIQLNRYFKQPAINYNIVMAQRLADEVNDEEVRKDAYKAIIKSITLLINENGRSEEIKAVVDQDLASKE